jgi:hypothetical protein
MSAIPSLVQQEVSTINEKCHAAVTVCSGRIDGVRPQQRYSRKVSRVRAAVEAHMGFAMLRTQGLMPPI